MKNCPKCHSEYEDAATRCADCDVELVAGRAPADEGTSGWSVIRTLSTDEEATLAAGFLNGEGVETTIESVNVHSLAETVGDLAEIRLLVRDEQVTQAKGLLEARDAEFHAGGPDDDSVMTDEGPIQVGGGDEPVDEMAD